MLFVFKDVLGISRRDGLRMKAQLEGQVTEGETAKVLE